MPSHLYFHLLLILNFLLFLRFLFFNNRAIISIMVSVTTEASHRYTISLHLHPFYCCMCHANLFSIDCKFLTILSLTRGSECNTVVGFWWLISATTISAASLSSQLLCVDQIIIILNLLCKIVVSQ